MYGCHQCKGHGLLIRRGNQNTDVYRHVKTQREDLRCGEALKRTTQHKTQQKLKNKPTNRKFGLFYSRIIRRQLLLFQVPTPQSFVTVGLAVLIAQRELLETKSRVEVFTRISRNSHSGFLKVLLPPCVKVSMRNIPMGSWIEHLVPGTAQEL